MVDSAVERAVRVVVRFWPLARGFMVTSGFGDRAGGFHWGTDFGKDGGSGGLPVFAAQGGTVTAAGAASGFGQWVNVDHPTEDGSGLTVYGHVLPEVSVGQRVEAGQRIARINPDSNTNGGVPPHLHLEVHRAVWSPPGPNRLDPLPWLDGAQYPGETTPGGSVSTVFGIDVSNHQRNFDFAQAKREGFAFATHKINEGAWRDPYWPRALDEGRKHFPGRFGGYVFCKVATNPDTEADVVADMCPRDVPLQIDYEDLDRNGSIGDLLARVNALTARGFRLLPIYLPRWYWSGWMGSPGLSGLPVEIWNSHYVEGSGFASALYPGDLHQGWAPMGGKDVAILQFTDKAQVAGQSIDANAVRGGEAKLAELFGGEAEDDMQLSDEFVNYKGIKVSIKDLLWWLDRHASEAAEQAGPWPQTGDLSNTDALAAIGESLGLPGFRLPDDHPYKQAHPEFGKKES